MPSFSTRSIERLNTCHPFLQQLLHEVVKYHDCSVLCGHRGKEEQTMAFQEGRSKTPWPESTHNKLPSLGVDVVPYPIVWPDFHKDPKNYPKDLARFYLFGGFVRGVALGMGIRIRWGGDWDGDWNILEQNFDDLPHFEVLL